jgi:hypothetical protein
MMYELKEMKNMNDLLVNANTGKEKKGYKKKLKKKLRKNFEKELIHEKDGQYQVYDKFAIKQHK